MYFPTLFIQSRLLILCSFLQSVSDKGEERVYKCKLPQNENGRWKVADSSEEWEAQFLRVAV